MYRQHRKNQDKVKNNWYVSQVANFQVFHGFSEARQDLKRLGFVAAHLSLVENVSFFCVGLIPLFDF